MSSTAASAPDRPRSRVRGFQSPPWAEKAVAPVLLVIAILLPFLFDPGSAFIADCVLALAYTVMALGLNIIVGFAGLLDLGYVAFFAIGAYTLGWFGSGLLRVRQPLQGRPRGRQRVHERAARHPPQLRAGGRRRGSLHDDGGRPHRPADAAAARRLHRDRDARLRRDHRPHRPQRRRHQAGQGPDPRRPAGERLRKGPDVHRGRPGHHADGQDLGTRAGSVHTAQPAALVLRRARPRGDRAVRQLPRARLAARPRLDRAARGRGRRGGHGRAVGQDEAARLRHRRGVRRDLGRVPRLLQLDGQRRPVPVLLLDPDPGHGDPRRARLDLGHGARRDNADVHQLLAAAGRAELAAVEDRVRLRHDADHLRDLRVPARDHDDPASAGPAPGAAQGDGDDQPGGHRGLRDPHRHGHERDERADRDRPRSAAGTSSSTRRTSPSSSAV